MRKLEYLSPTQLMLWKKDPKEYYNKYLSEHRPPRFPQTKAMAIGSAFDARVKSYLYNIVYKDSHNPKFSFENLFESQVESQNRDWALANEQSVWSLYKELGALQEMVLLLSKSTTAPDFETRITGTVNGTFTDSKNQDSEPSNSLPLQGVPDVSFSIHDLDIILDWKVNGFLSKASPKRGYIDILPGKMKHKDVFIRMHYGLPCLSDAFENYYDDWALQLTTYSWLLGKPIVNRSLLMIHQIAWNSDKSRIAVHSGICSDAYQENIFREYCDLWHLVNDYDALDSYYSNNYSCSIDDLEDIAYTNLGNSPEQRLYRELTH